MGLQKDSGCDKFKLVARMILYLRARKCRGVPYDCINKEPNKEYQNGKLVKWSEAASLLNSSRAASSRVIRNKSAPPSPAHANLMVGCIYYARGVYSEEETPVGVSLEEETPVGVYFEEETPVGVYFV